VFYTLTLTLDSSDFDYKTQTQNGMQYQQCHPES